MTNVRYRQTLSFGISYGNLESTTLSKDGVLGGALSGTLGIKQAKRKGGITTWSALALTLAACSGGGGNAQNVFRLTILESDGKAASQVAGDALSSMSTDVVDYVSSLPLLDVQSAPQRGLAFVVLNDGQQEVVRWDTAQLGSGQVKAMLPVNLQDGIYDINVKVEGSATEIVRKFALDTKAPTIQAAVVNEGAVSADIAGNYVVAQRAFTIELMTTGITPTEAVVRVGVSLDGKFVGYWNPLGDNANVVFSSTLTEPSSYKSSDLMAFTQTFTLMDSDPSVMGDQEITEGVHTVVISAEDIAGNVSNTTLMVTVDPNPPRPAEGEQAMALLIEPGLLALPFDRSVMLSAAVRAQDVVKLVSANGQTIAASVEVSASDPKRLLVRYDPAQADGQVLNITVVQGSIASLVNAVIDKDLSFAAIDLSTLKVASAFLSSQSVVSSGADASETYRITFNRNVKLEEAANVVVTVDNIAQPSRQVAVSAVGNNDAGVSTLDVTVRYDYALLPTHMVAVNVGGGTLALVGSAMVHNAALNADVQRDASIISNVRLPDATVLQEGVSWLVRDGSLSVQAKGTPNELFSLWIDNMEIRQARADKDGAVVLQASLAQGALSEGAHDLRVIVGVERPAILQSTFQGMLTLDTMMPEVTGVILDPSTIDHEERFIVTFNEDIVLKGAVEGRKAVDGVVYSYVPPPTASGSSSVTTSLGLTHLSLDPARPRAN